MTRRDWWLGVAVVAVAILLHTFVPRYEYRDFHGAPMVRVDRWTGRSTIGHFDKGEWTLPVASAEPIKK